ncbi:hypothetical protein [uncultured Desulfuromonas sp.]|uniref:hypothetical protein n=1 Tax=uncultured Desulfuromonas sp. TaxID=181013 RepID=UPI00262A9287|nr:hypothetical protein [uncultured Desulfuromonas sp.]
MNTALILIPAFSFVGLWLLIYSRRRSRLVKTFGAKKGLSYRHRDDGALGRELNRAFALAAPLGRDFSRIRDIVEGGGIRLFRATEALDLSPYGLPQNTHSGRIAVFFETEKDGEAFFLAKDARDIRHVLPWSTGPAEPDPGLTGLMQIIDGNPPPHQLSVTVMGGRFLAYLQPMLTGGEKESDLDYLYRLATRAKQTL